MKALSIPLVVVISLVGLRSCNGNLVRQKDRDILIKSSSRTGELCAESKDFEVNKDARSDLEAASGDNWVLKQMKGAKDSKEFEDNMANNMDFGFFITMGGPLMASFLFFIGYCCCCWTACPCCKCCRIRKGRHPTRPLVKLIMFGILFGCVVGVVIAAGMSQSGFNQAVAGLRQTSCTGSQMLNTTLGGQSSPAFLGMIPTLETFQQLIDNLETNSTFLTQLLAVITDTKDIEKSLDLATNTMDLLNKMMSSPNNKMPKSTGGTDLLHDCTLCPELEKVLTPAISALKDGVASQLNSARSEVRKQLTGPELKELQKSLTEATSPLTELMKLISNTFGPIVTDTSFQDLTDQIESTGLYCCLFLVMVALLVSCCACSGMSLWTCRELKKCESNPEEVQVGTNQSSPSAALKRGESKLEDGALKAADFANKHKAGVHRCALCTWCCGCFYMWFAFLVGGLLAVFSVPLASVCLILDDLSGQMLDDISGALGQNFTGDSGTILKNTIDQCFTNPNKNANPYMLDIIFTRNASGHAVPLRKTIVNDTRDAINDEFDKVTKSMNAGNIAMNSDANIVKLKNALRDTRMDAMMLPRTTYNWAGSTDYAPMASSTSLQPYMTSSAACADFTVPAGMGSMSGQAIKGINPFVGALSVFGTAQAHATCAKQVTCTSGNAMACAAGNKFMNLKQGLRSATTYKCRKFKLNGNKCDVKNMVESPANSGKYTNDCFTVAGKLEVFEYNCDLAEFTKLVQDFEHRLDKVFARLDKSTASSKDKISVDMKGLVNRYVNDQIAKIANGLTCGFLNTIYGNLIDATCYGGVWGFTQISKSYIACAALTLIMICVMYIVWRISVDNYNESIKVAEDLP